MSAALTTNVDQRLLRTTKFPPEFNVKVDMRKVNIHLIKSWAQAEIAKILKNDDDVVAELVSNILEESRYVGVGTWTRAQRVQLLTLSTAEHQRAPNITHRLPRQRCCALLPKPMEAMPECSRQSSRHSERVD